jgi:hypothetical protein
LILEFTRASTPSASAVTFSKFRSFQLITLYFDICSDYFISTYVLITLYFDICSDHEIETLLPFDTHVAPATVYQLLFSTKPLLYCERVATSRLDLLSVCCLSLAH